MKTLLWTSTNFLLLCFFSISDAVPFGSSTKNSVQTPERFSRALVTQFDSFKREHPIQAKLLQIVSDLLLPSSKTYERNGQTQHQHQHYAQDRVMGVMGSSPSLQNTEFLVPEASSYPQYNQFHHFQHHQPSSPSLVTYPNVRRSGRFLFPDEYEEKVKRFEAEQEQSLVGSMARSNNYHIINNQVRLGRVEMVRKPPPQVQVGVPFIPRGDGSGRKFEPSMVDELFGSLKDDSTLNGQDFHTPSPNNEFEKWKKFGVLPQESKSQPIIKQFSSEISPEMKSGGGGIYVDDANSNPNQSTEWSAMIMQQNNNNDPVVTKPRNPYEEIRPNVKIPFRRPFSVDASNSTPVLRPMYPAQANQDINLESPFNFSHNRITRQGKSLPFDGSSSSTLESEWQLLGTSGTSSEDKFVPSPPILGSSSSVGVGSVQIQPASAFSNLKDDPTASLRELPRLSKVMRPSTIRSQPLIVKDARDGRSLKEIEVQGVKIIVGRKTPDFPKDPHIYMRNNYVRNLGPISKEKEISNSNVDINVGSSITTL